MARPPRKKPSSSTIPPVVNRALGIRRSYINEASRVAQEFLKHDLQTMVFANSRLHTELILTYLQQANPQFPGKPETIRGYRGGYLPSERREIERGLRDGRIRGVVTTSAMELGIDVGSLDTVVMAGYPGTIAATWQRAGRAGAAAAVPARCWWLLPSPLDQFIVRHPDYFFGNTPEHAFIQPDNLEILINHLKCAAFELPDFPRTKNSATWISRTCARASPKRAICTSPGENYHWTNEAYPADTISLRSVTSDNFVIIDITGAPLVIGEVDFVSALTTVHEKAIYLHGGAAISRRASGLQGTQSVRETGGCGLLHRRDPLHASPRPGNRADLRSALSSENVVLSEAQGPHPICYHPILSRRPLPFPRRRPRALASGRLQENQILHQRKHRRGQARTSRKRNAHHVLLDHARPPAAGIASLLHQRAAIRHVRSCCTPWKPSLLCCSCAIAAIWAPPSANALRRRTMLDQSEANACPERAKKCQLRRQ